MGCRIVVLISGEGTNLQAMIDACDSGALKAKIVHVFSNKPNVGGLIRAHNAAIKTTIIEWDSQTESREMYDSRLSVQVQRQRPDIIVLAGWMHVLTTRFLSCFPTDRIINLHPALPGQFPGTKAIQKALESGATQTGAMCHLVVPEVDAGEVLSTIEVPIYYTDSIATLTARVKCVEKTVLLLGIMKIIGRISKEPKSVLIRRGKVRDVYSIGSEPPVLMMVATDRFSCFDRYVCDIPQKAIVINRLSAWWFEKTKHIIDNHLISVEPDTPISFVKECYVFPVEFVVRAYITGSTNTSMWTLYQRGERVFGNQPKLPEGLRKNQKLSQLYVTPTTKSDSHDEPITGQQLPDGIKQDQYEECMRISVQLFQHGQKIALERGLLLVDTKYEFGVEGKTGKIILVDEIHTCDSSRYWEANTYQERFENGMEPDRFDKDIIRNWIKERCDPYAINQDTNTPGDLPELGDELIEATSKRYIEFYERLTGHVYRPGFPSNAIAESAAIHSFFIPK